LDHQQSLGSIGSPAEPLKHDIASQAEPLKHDIASQADPLKHDIASQAEPLKHGGVTDAGANGHKCAKPAETCFHAHTHTVC